MSTMPSGAARDHLSEGRAALEETRDVLASSDLVAELTTAHTDFASGPVFAAGRIADEFGSQA